MASRLVDHGSFDGWFAREEVPHPVQGIGRGFEPGHYQGHEFVEQLPLGELPAVLVGGSQVHLEKVELLLGR